MKYLLLRLCHCERFAVTFLYPLRIDVLINSTQNNTERTLEMFQNPLRIE